MELYVKKGEEYVKVESMMTRLQRSLKADYASLGDEIGSLNGFAVAGTYGFVLFKEAYEQLDDMCDCAEMTHQRIKTFEVMLNALKGIGYELTFDGAEQRESLMKIMYRMGDKTYQLENMFKQPTSYLMAI